MIIPMNSLVSSPHMLYNILEQIVFFIFSAFVCCYCYSVIYYVTILMGHIRGLACLSISLSVSLVHVHVEKP